MSISYNESKQMGAMSGLFSYGKITLRAISNHHGKNEIRHG